MIRVRTMSPDDVAGIAIQPAQVRDWPESESDRRLMAMALIAHGRAFALSRDDGVLLALAGIIETHKNLASCWAILTVDAGPNLTGITRILRRYIAAMPHRRVDMKVRADFSQGHVWAEMLGFEAESVLRCWAPDGGDMIEFVRIRESGI